MHTQVSQQRGQLQTVIFDLVGTLVDFGSRAPVRALKQLFADAGITLARAPMGCEKRAHIAAILAMPAVKQQWQGRHSKGSNETDIKALCKAFEPLQLAAIEHALDLIPDAIEVLTRLKRIEQAISRGEQP